MPIPNIEQPVIIEISAHLRLRRYDGNYSIAFPWYQDEETLLQICNKPEKYDLNRLQAMYTYLDRQGEEYFIEYKDQDAFIPIGDVTFWQNDMPIVIGDRKFRNKGIAKQVIQTLLSRARQLGFRELYIGEIYKFNTASHRLFTSCGFKICGETEKAYQYKLDLI